MPVEFVSFAERAKQLGIDTATMRAQVLSERHVCFIYIPGVWGARPKDCAPLPSFDREAFPHAEWYESNDGREYPFWIKGWVALHPNEVAKALTDCQVQLNEARVYVCNADLSDGHPFILQVKPRKTVWVTCEGHDEGGFFREEDPVLTPPDLYLSVSASGPKKMNPRREASLLRIIAAMRSLLMTKDGGNFPSDAKIIDLLVERYNQAEGVSKRNLEKVFARASQVAGPDLKPKQ